MRELEERFEWADGKARDNFLVLRIDFRAGCALAEKGEVESYSEFAEEREDEEVRSEQTKVTDGF